MPRRRLLFEYGAHAACLGPASDLPWWRRAMLDYRSRHTGWSGWLRRNGKMLRTVQEAVQANGPMGNGDFEGRRAAGGGGRWSWRPVQHALHHPSMPGALTIHSRQHFQHPFDSLMWHRDRVARLFGFDYRIEVYTPGPRRVHGYYTLPILHHGHLIGRVDAKSHRAERRLEVRHVHFEPWFASAGTPPRGPDRLDLDEAIAGVASALSSLATFVGGDDVELRRVTPRRLRPALARRLLATSQPPDAGDPPAAEVVSRSI